MPVLLEPHATIDEPSTEWEGDFVAIIDRARSSLVARLSGGPSSWYGPPDAQTLPATMTRPVSFDTEPDERLRVVRWRPIDESLEDW